LCRYTLAPRTACLSVGRGAFTLGTARARPTEALRVPTLTLAGCLPAQRNATVGLCTAVKFSGPIA
jgi:anaphase-promoting complex subunit 1